MARALLVLELPWYSPIRSVPDVTAPIMFLSALRDTTCPPKLIQRAAELARHPGMELLEFDTSHFNLYQGMQLEGCLTSAGEFMLKHTVGAQAAAAAAAATDAATDAVAAEPSDDDSAEGYEDEQEEEL